MSELKIALINFLNENPTPTDQQFHAFAMSINVDKETLESEAFAMLSSFIRKFHTAHEAPDQLFDEEELEVGTQVELEHTEDEYIASIIAKDHLLENPNYYTDLLNAMPDEHPELRDELNNEDEEDEDDEDRLPMRMRQRPEPEQEIHVSKLGALKQKQPRPRVIQTKAAEDSEIMTSQDVYDIYTLVVHQRELDTIVRLLVMDGFQQEASLLSSAWSDFRSAVVKNAERAINDPLVPNIRRAIHNGRSRLNGPTIRIAYVRFATSALRSLAARYGDGAAGQIFFGQLSRA